MTKTPVTEQRDLPSIRRVFVAAFVAFTAIGLLRGTVQLISGPRPLLRAFYLFRTTLIISWFWIPVAVMVAALWRWRSRRVWFAAAHVVLVAVSVIGEVMWISAVFAALYVPDALAPFTFVLIGRFDTNLLIYAAIVGAVWAGESLRRANATRLAAARLETLLSGTRLHVLTLQLHPHFLFNTLNLISQLAYRDGAGARRTLNNLRSLLVESLAHAGRGDVPLRDEMRFLGAYLEIQQRRFGDRLRVRTDVTGDALDVAVPHLLLQPLVENAIIHGLADRPSGGEITIAARVDGDRLVVTVEDDGAGVDMQSLKEHVGLTNTRLRLRQFSSNDYRFTLAPRASGGTTVTIVVPAVVGPGREGAGIAEDGSDSVVSTPPRDASRLSIAVQTVIGWAALAVLWTELAAAQFYARNVPVAWGRAIASSVANALILGVLVAGALWISRRFDLVDNRSWKNIGGNVIGALSFAALHLVIYLAFLHRFVPNEFDIEMKNVFAWTVWDIVAYATIAAFGAVATLAARHRRALVSMIETRSRIANARIASLRLRLQPAVLLRGLDAIGTAMSVDPERAEHAIARMGDLLRALLSGVERDSASLDVEVATLRAFVDVVAPDATISIDDDVRDATVPAVLLTPLAATVGELASVVIQSHERWIDVCVRGRNAAVDEPQLEQIRTRLRRRYDDASTISVDRVAGELDVRLRIPVERISMVEDDEPLLEPALGFA